MENSGRNTAPKGQIRTHGLFIGEKHSALETAIALAQEKNIDFVETGIKKCVVYLTPEEFHSTWLGNKSVYRTRMAIADGGELLVLAPGRRSRVWASSGPIMTKWPSVTIPKHCSMATTPCPMARRSTLSPTRRWVCGSTRKISLIMISPIDRFA